LGERFGSGDGERKTLLTRKIAFEPSPPSVLFALDCPLIVMDTLRLVPIARTPKPFTKGASATSNGHEESYDQNEPNRPQHYKWNAKTPK